MGSEGQQDTRPRAYIQEAAAGLEEFGEKSLQSHGVHVRGRDGGMVGYGLGSVSVGEAARGVVRAVDGLESRQDLRRADDPTGQ